MVVLAWNLITQKAKAEELLCAFEARKSGLLSKFQSCLDYIESPSASKGKQVPGLELSQGVITTSSRASRWWWSSEFPENVYQTCVSDNVRFPGRGGP